MDYRLKHSLLNGGPILHCQQHPAQLTSHADHNKVMWKKSSFLGFWFYRNAGEFLMYSFLKAIAKLILKNEDTVASFKFWVTMALSVG